jgi:ABC-2 type transport system permease protein
MEALRRLPAIYYQQLKTSLAEQVQYRAALAIWLLEVALTPTVTTSVWSTVAHSEGGTVNGYTSAGFAAYFIATMLVNYCTQTWVFWEFNGRIQRGEFSPLLLRPVHPIHADVADSIAYKLIMFPLIALTGLLLYVAFHATFTVSWSALLAFLAVLCLACALRFVLEWTLALLAFWLTQVSVINQFYMMVFLFLSGQLVPLTFLPAPLQSATDWLPFRWLISFPVEVLLGRLTAGGILSGLLVQLSWLLCALVLLRITWRRGIRRYSAVGG